MSYTLTVINEEWVLPNANFKYVKSSGIVNLIEDFALESKNYKKSNPTADVYVQFYYTAGKGQIIEFTDTFNFSDNFSIDKLYAYGNVLKLKFKDINTKTTGNLDFVVTITVKNRTGAETFETIETIYIDGNVDITDNAGTITHNLESVNFANDDLYINALSDSTYLLELTSEITYQGKTKEVVLEELFLDGKSSTNLKGVFQPFIYLTDDQINEFFEEFKLNIEPATVVITAKFLNEKFETLQTTSVGTFSFYAGKKANLFNNGDVINRSLNYNTFLPLPYEYPTQNIKITYNELEKTIDKQALSSNGKILQLLFSQRSNGFVKNKLGVFSSGFSSGFATDEALAAAKSIYLYKPGYTNKIESYYKVIGYNFPWQKQAFNIIWLDENNIFRSLPITGVLTGEKQIKNYLNENAENRNHYKAGVTIKDTRKANTGFILNSETDLVINLQKAKKAWFFGDDPAKRIFCVAVNPKVTDVDTERDLIQYDLDLEFYE